MNQTNNTTSPLSSNHHPQPNRSLKSWMTSTADATGTTPRVLILDGGISTHLERTHPFSNRRLWSSSLLTSSHGQRAIQDCHEEFYRAGSDIVSTVTYQCSHIVCGTTNDGNDNDNRDDSSTQLFGEEDVDVMLLAGVRLAHAAREKICKSDDESSRSFDHKYVMGSIGCYGAALADGSEYLGRYGVPVEDLIKFHHRRLQVFWEAEYVDAVAFETVPALEEVEAIVTLLRQQQLKEEQGPAVWISLACKDGMHLNDGSPIEDALGRIEDLDPEGLLVHGIGVNCFAIKHLYTLVEKITTHLLCSKTQRAILFYPNSGEEWDAGNQTWKKGTKSTPPTQFAQMIVKCINNVHGMCQESNTKMNHIPIIVGGCCRTSPDTICSIRSCCDEYFN